MVEVRYWGSLFPLITIVLLIISLFFPVMSVSIDYSPVFNIEDKLYITGGGIIDAIEPYIDSYPEIRDVREALMDIIIIRIILIISTSILSIISAILLTTRSKGVKIAKIMWIVTGISLLTSQIFLLPYSEIFIYLRTYQDVSLTMGFGMIFLMIGGAVLLLGAVWLFYLKKMQLIQY
ncbi:MAG: hypothetical protein ACFFAQ_09080 [Promethearchaeota archaeon]